MRSARGGTVPAAAPAEGTGGAAGAGKNVAAVDVGSNAIRFFVAEPTGRSAYRVLENRREPVRLGGDVFLAGDVRPATLRAAEQAFRDFRLSLRRLSVGTVRAVATCALREARNAELVVERLEQVSGIRVEVISGEEEARLVALAVGRKIPLKGRRVLMVDLGGGSVEISLADDGRIVLAESHNFGAVRLLDLLSSPGGSGGGQIGLLRDYMELVARRLKRRGRPAADLLVATGGNVEAAALLPPMEAGPHPSFRGVLTLRTEKLKEVVETLAGMSVKARMERFGLREDRADVILPACFAYLKIAEAYGMKEILVPRVSLKDGVVLDLLSRTREKEHRRDLREQVLVSCRELLDHYRAERGHAEQVARLAVRLFDETAAHHRLGERERLHLEAAALLHDTGYFISIHRHHKHSHYLIANTEIVGLPPEERKLVALVARYHRKSPPVAEHEEYEALPRNEKAAVRTLAAILRVADGLDREHVAAVRDLSCAVEGETLRVRLQPRRDCRLEVWSALRKADMLRDSIGLDVAFDVRKGG